MQNETDSDEVGKSDWQGPYVQYACFCEKVLVENDGSVSLIRVFDQLTLTKFDPPEFGPNLPPFPFMLMIGLKAGRASGRYPVRIIPRNPSGLAGPPIFQDDMLLEGDHRGSTIQLQMEAPSDYEGLHWYEVWFGDMFLVKMPLKIVHRIFRLQPGQIPDTGQ